MITSTLLAFAVGLFVVWLVLRLRGKGPLPKARPDESPKVTAFCHEALAEELARGVPGLRGGTPQERQALKQTLAGNPDVRVVAAIEDAVRDVELEYVRYAHEDDAQVSLRVKYEDGSVGSKETRMPLADLPEGVRDVLQKAGVTRAFRPFVLPWR